MKKKLNETDYFLNENAVFENKEFRECFYKKLKKEYNTQPYDFLEEVKTMKETVSKSEKNKKWHLHCSFGKT